MLNKINNRLCFSKLRNLNEFLQQLFCFIFTINAIRVCIYVWSIATRMPSTLRWQAGYIQALGDRPKWATHEVRGWSGCWTIMSAWAFGRPVLLWCAYRFISRHQELYTLNGGIARRLVTLRYGLPILYTLRVEIYYKTSWTTYLFRTIKERASVWS